VKLIIPVANMNGNHASELIEQLQTAHEAIGKAVEALRACEYSNGRNFQTLANGGELGQQARTQHGEWLQSLETVKHNVIEVAYELSIQK